VVARGQSRHAPRSGGDEAKARVRPSMTQWRRRSSSRRSATWRSLAAAVASARSHRARRTAGSFSSWRGTCASAGSELGTSPDATRSASGISHGGGRSPRLAPRYAPGNWPARNRRLMVSRETPQQRAAPSRVSGSSTPEAVPDDQVPCTRCHPPHHHVSDHDLDPVHLPPHVPPTGRYGVASRLHSRPTTGRFRASGTTSAQVSGPARLHHARADVG
jgi:hypothetical protein